MCATVDCLVEHLNSLLLSCSWRTEKIEVGWCQNMQWFELHVSSLGFRKGAKTCTGITVQGQHRIFDPKAYASSGARCPVMIYYVYKSYSLAAALTDDSPFYLELSCDGNFDHLRGRGRKASTWQKNVLIQIIEENDSWVSATERSATPLYTEKSS